MPSISMDRQRPVAPGVTRGRCTFQVFDLRSMLFSVSSATATAAPNIDGDALIHGAPST